MSLTNIEQGAVATSTVLNNNFNYLDDRCDTLASTKANNTGLVHTTGIEIIAGNKTFQGDTTFSGNVSCASGTTTTLAGTNSLTGATTISGATTLSGTTTVSGAATFSSTVTLPSTTTSTLISNVMPDLTAGVSKTWGATWTAPSNGWVYAFAGARGGYAAPYITINSISFTVSQNGIVDETISASIMIPVMSGDTIYSADGSALQSIKFYPCKGVS